MHVALPDVDGPAANHWRSNRAHVHKIDFILSFQRPLETRESFRQLRGLVERLKPDLVHAHTVTTVMIARMALRRFRSLVRLFQVPGPFHLEHAVFRVPEIFLGTSQDYWVATSRAIASHYLKAGVPQTHVFLSYSGTDNCRFGAKRSGWLRAKLEIPAKAFVVGNINHIYSPMRFLINQKMGVKCHEDLIEGLSIASDEDTSIRGVLIGGPWGPDSRYFELLRQRARERSGGAVIMPGAMSAEEVALAIPDFDCAAHVPSSENCGGVVEPLLYGVPTVASRVGGLPEVVMDGVTGLTVPVHDPPALAHAILAIRNRYAEACEWGRRGQSLVRTMFDIERTGLEVFEIYRHVLGYTSKRPVEFDAKLLANIGPPTGPSVLSPASLVS